MANTRTPLTFTSGVTQAADVPGMSWIGVYLKADGTVSAGAVTIQTCDWMPAPATDPPDAAWVTVGSAIVPPSGANVQTLTQLPVGAYSKVRLKITTPLVGGGALTAVVVANGS